MEKKDTSFVWKIISGVLVIILIYYIIMPLLQ